MIPKKFRFSLREDKDFFRKSKRIFVQTMTCFWQEAEHIQLAVVVPKKQIKLATDRNRMKRQVSQALYRELKMIEPEHLPHKKMVLVLKKHPRFEEIYEKDIETILRKLFK